MIIAEKILLSAHLVAGIVWVGSVFMGTFIDWPTAKSIVKKGNFPFDFIVGQGRRVFYSVYFGICMLWSTGLALFFVHPPANSTEIGILLLKTVCLFLMTAFTLYGTFFTWPKIQFATHEEAFNHYKFYMYRAIGTFTSGIIGSILTLWFYIYKL